MRRSARVLILVAILVACGKTKTGSPNAAPSAGAPISSAAPPASVSADPIDELSSWSVPRGPLGKVRPWVDEAGRAGRCSFVGWTGSGAERASTFDVVLPAGKKVAHAEALVFYYDKAGTQLRSAQSFSDHPGIQSLGEKGAQIPSDVDVVECEVIDVRYDDHTSWWNLNLTEAHDRLRPRGGFSRSLLKEHSGERVTVTKIVRGVATVRNLTDRPVKRVFVQVVCWKKDDATWKNQVTNVELAGGATTTVEIPGDWSDLDRCDAMEGAVPRVELADGTVFENQNLDVTARP